MSRARKAGPGWAPPNPVATVCLAFGLTLALPAGIRAADSLEYRVKAAFLLNFTKFTEWPAASFAAADSPIEICILGEDPFGAALDQIVAGEIVNGRRVVSRRIKQAPTPKSCAVLFVSQSDKGALKTLPPFGPGVLTVGEGEDFVRHGGMIAFIIENRRVRFDVNRTAAEKAGLELSSKLLSIARAVE